MAKRKAAAAATDEPPAKRATRSSARAAPQPALTQLARTRGRGKALEAADDTVEQNEETAPKAPVRATRGRPRKKVVEEAVEGKDESAGEVEEEVSAKPARRGPPRGRDTAATAVQSPEIDPPKPTRGRGRRKAADVVDVEDSPEGPLVDAKGSDAGEVEEKVSEKESTKDESVEVPDDGDEPAIDASRITRTRGRGARGRGGSRTQTTRTKGSEPTTKRRPGRPPTKKAPVQIESSTQSPEASSSKVIIEALQRSVGEESEDELLLKSPRNATPRPSTPPKRTTIAHGTPRMVLDAVEVPTPSKRMREIQNLIASRPGSPNKPAASPVKPFPPRAVTPTRPLTTPKASPTRITRTRLAEPEEDDELVVAPPLSPTRALPATPAKSPNKGKAVAIPQASPSRLPRVLPPELCLCLEAQKRAILKALQELSVLPDESATPEADDDEEDVQPSTNALAYEQLTSLLKGTVERGEGNSCMVIGPRGSGKTQVSRWSPKFSVQHSCRHIAGRACHILVIRIPDRHSTVRPCSDKRPSRYTRDRMAARRANRSLASSFRRGRPRARRREPIYSRQRRHRRHAASAFSPPCPHRHAPHTRTTNYPRPRRL